MSHPIFYAFFKKIERIFIISDYNFESSQIKCFGYQTIRLFYSLEE